MMQSKPYEFLKNMYMMTDYQKLGKSKKLKRFDDNEINAIKKVVEKGKYLSGFTSKFRGGDEVQKFEEEFAKYIGAKYAITVNSGTSALFIAFKTAMEYGKINKNIRLKKP